jgi:hypothetical protein
MSTDPASSRMKNPVRRTGRTYDNVMTLFV